MVVALVEREERILLVKHATGVVEIDFPRMVRMMKRRRIHGVRGLRGGSVGVKR